MEDKLLAMDELLHYAIEAIDFPLLLSRLEEEPQRLEERDGYGQTPLLLAVTTTNRSLDCIRLLLGAGADVNARNLGGYTALHAVIWNEYFPVRAEEIILLLLEAGSPLEDDHNHWAATPLMVAVMEDMPAIAQQLLARGANPNCLVSQSPSLESCRGHTLLSLAWLRPTMMRVLIQGDADVNLRNERGQTTLEHIQKRDAGQFEDQKQESMALLRQA